MTKAEAISNLQRLQKYSNWEGDTLDTTCKVAIEALEYAEMMGATLRGEKNE